MASDSILTFDDLEEVLTSNDSETTASELQGMVCGLFSGGMPAQSDDWKALVIQQVNEHEPLVDGSMERLNALVQDVVAMLFQDIFNLDLLLPTDDCPLIDRLEALSQWCQGFLLGYGLQIGDKQPDSEDLQEAVKDLSEIAMVDLDIEEDEEMEQAFFTVYEHVRVAAQVIFVETNTPQQKPEDDLPTSQDTVH
ncbi:UPF0149 family protein [Pleionea sp. CnH1-48]|uniref:UPF0149 family protein n=1 Tax=Pleionea sp. CnH1-48 TaxID=2954494 RepID=UPI00209867B1|nr:UPF0149 family protein [Pleionea sp. CnH1-48]MCO7226226.1 UPF0149 family protein [Pleionea sp. CnH1-48]